MLASTSLFRREPLNLPEWYYCLKNVEKIVVPLMHDRTFPTLRQTQLRQPERSDFNYHRLGDNNPEVILIGEGAERGLEMQGIFGITHPCPRHKVVAGGHGLWGLTRGGLWINGTAKLTIEADPNLPTVFHDYRCHRIEIAVANLDKIIAKHKPAMIVKEIELALSYICADMDELMERVQRARFDLNRFLDDHSQMTDVSKATIRFEQEFPLATYQPHAQSRPIGEQLTDPIPAEVFLTSEKERICPGCSHTYYPMERYGQKCPVCKHYLPPESSDKESEDVDEI